MISRDGKSSNPRESFSPSKRQDTTKLTEQYVLTQEIKTKRRPFSAITKTSDIVEPVEPQFFIS